MAEHHGQWIAALIMLALLLAVIVLFGTVDLGFDEHIPTDVSSAPILSGDETDATEESPRISPEATVSPEASPTPAD